MTVDVRHLEDAEPGAAFDGREAELRALFERPESEVRERVEAMLAAGADWLTEYHLSPQRRLLLSWYPFPPEGTVLEVGAGCGALTGLLSERSAHVYANEKYATRAEVIARRYADRDNLTVLVGGIERIELSSPADTLVCVGVWEYAGVFMAGDPEEGFSAPFERFLAVARRLVRRGGRMLIAIENKLGLEYLAGAEEDHLDHGVLASVEGYPDYAGVRTFSREEIRRLLAAADFGDPVFYFPFPDYKLPQRIVREGAFDALRLTPAQLGQLVPGHRPRLALVNDQLLARALLDECVMESFANSFLIDIPA